MGERRKEGSKSALVSVFLSRKLCLCVSVPDKKLFLCVLLTLDCIGLHTAASSCVVVGL